MDNVKLGPKFCVRGGCFFPSCQGQLCFKLCLPVLCLYFFLRLLNSLSCLFHLRLAQFVLLHRGEKKKTPENYEVQRHHLWLRKSPSSCCWQLRECSGKALLSLHACLLVRLHILATAMRPETGLIIHSLTHCNPFVGCVFPPLFMLLLLNSSQAAVLELAVCIS